MSEIKLLFAGSGPENVRATLLDTVNGWKVWSIDKWSDNQNSASIAIEFPDRGLVPMATPARLPQVRDFLAQGKDPFAQMRQQLETSLAQMRTGEGRTINLVAARLFGCYDEAKALADQRFAAREQERKREAEDKARREAETKRLAIGEGEAKVRQGEAISADTFELLLAKHGIDVHPRTLGWIRDGLMEIHADGYRFSYPKGTHRTGSTKAMAAYRALQQVLPPEPSAAVPSPSSATTPAPTRPTTKGIFASPRML